MPCLLDSLVASVRDASLSQRRPSRIGCIHYCTLCWQQFDKREFAVHLRAHSPGNDVQTADVVGGKLMADHRAARANRYWLLAINHPERGETPCLRIPSPIIVVHGTIIAAGVPCLGASSVKITRKFRTCIACNVGHSKRVKMMRIWSRGSMDPTNTIQAPGCQHTLYRRCFHDWRLFGPNIVHCGLISCRFVGVCMSWS